MKSGTLPHSILVGTCIGTACGVAVFLYYEALFGLMHLMWKYLPQRYVVGRWPAELEWLWIPLVLFTFALGTGLSVWLLGDPGDLAYVVKCVHEPGFITFGHLVPMVFASLFTIGKWWRPRAPAIVVITRAGRRAVPVWCRVAGPRCACGPLGVPT